MSSKRQRRGGSRRLALPALAATLLAGCGDERGAPPPGCSWRSRATFGGAVPALPARAARAAADGDEPAVAQHRRQHPLRRRLRAERRRALRRGWRAAPTDWLYYVNGVEAHAGPPDDVHPVTRIWWTCTTEPDRRRARRRRLLPRALPGWDRRAAGAGARGMGRAPRWPLPHRPRPPARRRGEVRRSARRGRGGGAPHPAPARGTWPSRCVGGGPCRRRASRRAPRERVYARVPPGGRTIALLDARAPARAHPHRHAGLLAATRYAEETPRGSSPATPDPAGVQLRRERSASGSLHDRFAVALTATGRSAAPAPTEPMSATEDSAAAVTESRPRRRGASAPAGSMGRDGLLLIVPSRAPCTPRAPGSPPCGRSRSPPPRCCSTTRWRSSRCS